MIILNHTIKFFIGGEWTKDDPFVNFFDVVDPFVESVLGRAPEANAATIATALAAARTGHAIWRNTSTAKRSDLILQACQLLRDGVSKGVRSYADAKTITFIQI